MHLRIRARASRLHCNVWTEFDCSYGNPAVSVLVAYDWMAAAHDVVVSKWEPLQAAFRKRHLNAALKLSSQLPYRTACMWIEFCFYRLIISPNTNENRERLVFTAFPLREHMSVITSKNTSPSPFGNIM